ncbi:MAG TPA: FAD-dependent oxidoreductase [Thermoanaerobaculia bacterium]|nr:FAD-dependent oxidoreductase [Thermoanaerobaculia bacterium]
MKVKDELIEEGAAFQRLEEGRLPSAAGRTERFDAVVIGGGQAGLSVGYHLAQSGLSLVILDAQARTGDSWRQRWDSLRLFTPALFDGLDGMPFPAPPFAFPTKDQMADYLESYARRFELPVRHGVRVKRLTREGATYVVVTEDGRFEAEHVVVAMSGYQTPRVPDFADRLDPSIVQLHSRDYLNPSQLRPGSVLVVGAGNSGAEIALELARAGHPVWMSGRDVGHIPFRITGLPARLFLARLVLRGLFHRILTMSTPLGRTVRPKIIARGGPLIRVRPRDLEAHNVQRASRVAGISEGRPQLEDGRILDAANVVWCTGFHPGFSWIELPAVDERGRPIQDRGVAAGEPGLYFVGMLFLYAFSSSMIHGVGRDARHVARTILGRVQAARRDGKPAVRRNRTSRQRIGATA